MLTDAASVLAMIPLTKSVLWGPMTIMDGLIIATPLTTLFLPALYASWFRVERGPRMAIQCGARAARPPGA